MPLMRRHASRHKYHLVDREQLLHATRGLQMTVVNRIERASKNSCALQTHLPTKRFTLEATVAAANKQCFIGDFGHSLNRQSAQLFEFPCHRTNQFTNARSRYRRDREKGPTLPRRTPA